jgi:ABC-type multidrug transport system fused ATPase/permease subunit
MWSFLPREIRWLGRQAILLLRLNMILLMSIMAVSVLTLLDPLIIKWMIDVAIVRRSTRLLLIGTTVFVLVYCGHLAFSYSAYLMGFVIGQKMIFRIRVSLIRRLHILSAPYYANMPVGEIHYRVEQDVDRIGELGGDVLPNMMRLIIVALMVIVTMAVLNLRLSLIIVPLLPVFCFLQHRGLRRLSVAAEKTQQQMGTISAFLLEYLSGMVQLQLLNRTGTHGRKFLRLLAAGANIQTSQRRAEIRFSGISMSVIGLGSMFVLACGGYDVIHGRLTIGGLVAFYSYVIRLLEPMSAAVDLQSKLQRVGASIRRIREIVGDDKIDEIGRTGQGCRLTKEDAARLEFREISFSYRMGRKVLDGLSFGVDRGEKVALVGVSGSGKSTIGYLATRMYEPDRGSVIIDGLDIRHLGQRNLRSIVTIVPQEPVLFDVTMRENLLYGNPAATSRDLDRVLSLAQLHDVIRRLPQGLEEPLGPVGGKLSGGEKKRVALARAFLQEPQILILDEVTSALDGPTVASLLEALDSFRQGRSVILISHKPSAISWAHRIVVLDQGKILDEGGHQELVRRCELYRLLYHGLSREASDREEIGAFEP